MRKVGRAFKLSCAPSDAGVLSDKQVCSNVNGSQYFNSKDGECQECTQPRPDVSAQTQARLRALMLRRRRLLSKSLNEVTPGAAYF
eukprot:6212273-Pleurochrysis_carterae.AAC.6